MDMHLIQRATSRDEWLERLTAIAAEMAGYDVDRLATPWNGGARDQGELWLGFATRARVALEALAPCGLDAEESRTTIPEALHNQATEAHHFVRTVREWRGMPLAALARLSGLSAELIEAIEQRRIVPSLYQERALARALDVAPECVTDWPQVMADAAALRDDGELC